MMIGGVGQPAQQPGIHDCVAGVWDADRAEPERWPADGAQLSWSSRPAVLPCRPRLPPLFGLKRDKRKKEHMIQQAGFWSECVCD